MAGNANSGRRPRTMIPTGKAAEEELRRIRRQERRRLRAAKKRAEENGEVFEEEEFMAGDPSTLSNISPEDLKPPTLEELKQDLMYAFKAMGGRAGLVAWGRRYPKEFYALWMKHCAPDSSSEAPAEAGSLESMLADLDKQGSTLQ